MIRSVLLALVLALMGGRQFIYHIPPTGTPTLVQHVAGAMEDNAGNGVPSITAQLPNPSLSGNALVLCVQMDQPGGVGVTISDDKTNTWTAGPVRIGTNQTLSLFYALNATAATRAITMTFSGATKPNHVQASISEFYNVATSSASAGSTGASATSPSAIAAGSFTPSSNGTLVYHCGVDDTNPGQYNGGTVTAGSGFTLLNADRQNGTAAQYQVQTSAAAVNPSFTVGADRWDSVAIALKPATAGTAPSAGMRIVHVQHSLLAWVDNAGRPNHSTPVVLQFPSSGNLIVGLYNHSGYFLTGVTDSASNTWASAVQQLDSPAQVVSSQIVYAANATTSNSLNNLTFTFSHAVDVGHAMIVLYDITGAATSPLGATHGSDGVQSVNANLSMDTITPTQSSSLVFNVGSIWGHTTNGTAGVALFDAWVNPIDNNAGGAIQTPASYLDMDNPLAHYVTPSTSAVTFTYSFNGTPPPTGIQQWSSVSAEFKTASLFAGTIRNAATCSRTDVNTQIAASSPGDIVNVPAGASCDWSAGLTVSGIALRCAGSSTSGTVVTAGLVTVTKHATSYTQVSSCRFSGTDKHLAVGGTSSNKAFIIDNNYLNVDANPWASQATNGGLWFSNTFFGSTPSPHDGFSMNLGVSAASAEWDAATTMGTADTTGETNTYFEDNAWTNLLEVAIDCDEGSRVAVRHNTFTDSSMVAHAGGSGGSGNDTSTHGCRQLEIYNNTFIRITNAAAVNKWIWMRGTTGVFANNTVAEVSSPDGSSYPFKYEVQLRVGCVNGGYPRQYQVGQNSKTADATPDQPYLIFGNTGAGVNSAQWIQIAENNSGAPYTACATPTDFIQLGRDYQTSNTWGWSPYTYPHPLRSGL